MRSWFGGSAGISKSWGAERATSAKARTKTVLAGHKNNATTQRYIELDDHALREPVARVGSPHQLYNWLLRRGQRHLSRRLSSGANVEDWRKGSVGVCLKSQTLLFLHRPE